MALLEPPSGGAGGGVGGEFGGPSSGAAGQLDLGGEGGDGGPTDFSAGDDAAIERLLAIYPDREVVVQAFVAAGRNEELAANLIFDMMG